MGRENYDNWKLETPPVYPIEKTPCSFCGELYDEDELTQKDTKETRTGSVLLPSRIEHCCDQCAQEIAEYERQNS